jgi:hypothetical protein
MSVRRIAANIAAGASVRRDDTTVVAASRSSFQLFRAKALAGARQVIVSFPSIGGCPEVNLIQRALQARHNRVLLSAVARRIGLTGCVEAELRFRLGLPKVNGRDFPAIVTSGNFSSNEACALKASLQAAIDGRSKLPPAIRAIKGMSGQRYRTLINTLIASLDRPRYLEIGSFLGSTAAAAIYGNGVQAVCIDNWSEFSGTKEQFLANMKHAKSDLSSLRLIEQDFRKVDYGALGKFNVYLFDGPHSETDHREGILMVQPCLADRFLLIVDDWNWPEVRLGTASGLLAADCHVEASVQVRTTMDNKLPAVGSEASDWHNGYFIAVIGKMRFASPRRRGVDLPFCGG